MKRVLCFYIPEPLAKGYKTHNMCHKYRMKRTFITDSFYHMFNPQKREINRVFFYRFYCEKRDNVGTLPMTS